MKTESVQKYHIIFLLLVSLICYSGCATTGGAKGPSKQDMAMTQITKGTTTKEEVRGILGNPNGKYQNSDSTEMWTYSNSDFNKKMANNAVAGTAASAAAFIPVIGPAIGLATFAKIGATPTKISTESVTIVFDSKGVVSNVSSSSQEIGGY